MIFSDIGGSRQLPEPVLRMGGIVVILMARPVRKTSRFLQSKMQPLTHFVQSCVFYVFFVQRDCYSIFVILSARRLHFRSYFDYLLRALGL